jgi:putative DNA primase/helicase
LSPADTTDTNQSDAASQAGVGASGTSSQDVQHPEAPPISSDPCHITHEEFEQAHAEAVEYMALVPDDTLPTTSAGTPPDDDSWKEQLLMVSMTNKATKEVFQKPERKSQNNIYLMTRYHPITRGMFIMNEFSRRKMVVRCPPWERPAKFKPRDVRDDDYSRITMELERMGLAPTRDKAAAAIEAICHDRAFHPVQKYFRSLKWDGTKRLDSWLRDYLFCVSEPAAYLTGVGTKWMVGAVARIFQPGCKFDHMLVLEGATDIGKSKAFRTLSTFHGEEYFYDGMTFAKIGDKDTMQNIQGALIIEFPELSSLQSREVEDVKQWITVQEDRGRKPYGREPVMYPRQFVLAGSTNNSEYLKDQTGNKRFWPVKCGARIDHAGLEVTKSQLWAEAVHLYLQGYQWWIPEGDPLFQMCAAVAAKRLTTHPWENDVVEYINGKDIVTVSEILIKRIEKKLKEITRGDEMVIAGILKQAGFEKYTDGKVRSWRRIKMIQPELMLNEEDIPQVQM